MKYLGFIKILLITLLLQACEQSMEFAGNSVEVDFRICESVPTRSGKMIFNVGDSIGIFAVKRVDVNKPALPGSQNNQAHNVKWVKTAEGWRPASAVDKVVWVQDGTPLDFYAYYPYQRDVMNPDSIILAVQKNQIDEQALILSDFLRAVNIQGLTEGVVELNFSHQFALINVKLIREGGGIESDAALVATDVCTKVAFNLGTGVQTPMETGRVQLFCENPASHIYQGIVPAQEFTGGTATFQIDDKGVTYVYAFKDMTLQPGSCQRFELNLK